MVIVKKLFPELVITPYKITEMELKPSCPTYEVAVDLLNPKTGNKLTGI
jgi:hypothetical protein